MRVLFLTSNRDVTQPLIDWLSEREEIFVEEGKVDEEYVQKARPDIMVSYNYATILCDDVIRGMGGKIINLHISLLPYNRGSDPNFWSFYEDTPKGVTIHQIDAGVDTGSILLQKEAMFDENIETLKTSYQALHQEIQKLFTDNWDKLKNGEIALQSQSSEEGTFHKAKEFRRIKELCEERFAGSIYDVPICKLKQYLSETGEEI